MTHPITTPGPAPRTLRVTPRRVGAGVLLACVFLVMVAAPGLTHSALQSASPGPDSTTVTPIAELELVFAQTIDVLPDSVQVLGSDGQRSTTTMSTLGPDEATISVALDTPLQPGSHTVRWRVIGADGHPIDGSYAIAYQPPTAPPRPAGVGPPADSPPPPTAPPSLTPSPTSPGADPTAPDQIARDGDGVDVASTATLTTGVGDPPAAPAEPAAPMVLQTVSRAVAFTGILLVLGILAFTAAVRPPAELGGAALRRVVTVAAGAACAGAAVQLVAHVAVVSGTGLAGALDPPSWGVVSGTGLMAATALRVGASVMVILGARVGRHSPSALPLWGLAGLLLLASFQFTGHTASSEPSVYVRVADAAHVAGASVWTGGVLALIVIMAAGRRRGSNTAAVAARFTVLATAAVLLVAVAGAALAVVELDAMTQLITTGYGRLLLAKLGVVAVIGGIGAYNHSRLVPAMVEGSARATILIRRTTAVELALFLVVIALTAALVQTAP